MKKQIMDGNTACASVSYLFTEVAGIYPITPSSTMAEKLDEMAKAKKENLFNDQVKVVEMQSEAGAIATVHGLLQNGVISSSYTASQGLLLMIPNMYKIAGEMLPCTLHVAARTIATHALSILGDHSDIYAARSTGFCMLASTNPQEVPYLTAVAHIASLKGKLPILHFFDGFRTSHEYQKINIPEKEDLKEFLPTKEIEEFRNHSMNCIAPSTRGTNQSDQVYFQSVEARNSVYMKMPDVINKVMEDINKKFKTNLAPFTYYGDKTAKKVIVAMGSVCDTIKEVIDTRKEKVGLIEVHLYRPFSKEYFLKVLPKSVRKIAVLDRTKESGATGEPLYLDVCEVLKDTKIKIVGGRYGLSGKNTTPNDIDAIYDFLDQKSHPFTIGIVDDVTNLSLEKTKRLINNNHEEMLIYGYGSDGMLTMAKELLTIVGENTNKEVQGYFEYDSKKSGGLTKSHLRFSNNPIRSSYYVTNPSVIVVSKDTYFKKYDILSEIKEKGILLLNTELENYDQLFTSEQLDILKNKKIKVYVINASKIAQENNIPNKISMIMECAFLKITSLCDFDFAYNHLKEFIKTHFASKGEEVVNSNINALNETIDSLKEIDIKDVKSVDIENNSNDIFTILEQYRGNELPVSKFLDVKDGVFSKEEQKLQFGISTTIPVYNHEKCISCNFCSFVCPHGVIRPYLLTKEELDKAPELVKEQAKDAKVKDKELYFTICIEPNQCTGCGLCVKACPTMAITMQSFKENSEKLKEAYDYLESLPTKEVYPKNTIKGIGFEKPKFEFPGACAGCGETAYIRLLTQLFQDKLMIANATGCSSIYGASIPNIPYSVNWANSLFEDNAEFGYGMSIAESYMKERIIKKILSKKYRSKKAKDLLEQYNETKDDELLLSNIDAFNLEDIKQYKKYLSKKSFWIVGGDGWAYDIGFGGIDHVLSTNQNVNILVLDTECYSNTGGQTSKATRRGAIAKFASNGKETPQKDLAKIAMCYPNVYVATISLGANYQQTINALIEAEKHNGPSIIIAYSPCIAHGIKKGMSTTNEEQKQATKTGYFPLFRYNPTTNEFKMDSKADFSNYLAFLQGENRYRNQELLEKNEIDAKSHYNYLETKSKENNQ